MFCFTMSVRMYIYCIYSWLKPLAMHLQVLRCIVSPKAAQTCFQDLGHPNSFALAIWQPSFATMVGLPKVISQRPFKSFST